MALVEINSQIVGEAIEKQSLARLTFDIDGSVITTGATVAWAYRGFNPHHRKDPSYYPILFAPCGPDGPYPASEESAGNVHDSKGALAFIRELIDDVRVRLGKSLPLEFRMDGAFFQREIIALLERTKSCDAIKVPLVKWLGLVPIIRERQRHRLGDAMGYFEVSLYVAAWDKTLRMVVYRNQVHHESQKNYQLDLFDPDDGYFEYSAICTNL